MDTTMAMTRLEGAIQQQVIVAGGDQEVEVAARAILSALGPAVRQLAFDLAEQAAAEVASQLPGHHIEVVLAAGEPTLRVRARRCSRSPRQVPSGPAPPRSAPYPLRSASTEHSSTLPAA